MLHLLLYLGYCFPSPRSPVSVGWIWVIISLLCSPVTGCLSPPNKWQLSSLHNSPAGKLVSQHKLRILLKCNIHTRTSPNRLKFCVHQNARMSSRYVSNISVVFYITTLELWGSTCIVGGLDILKFRVKFSFII